MLEELEKIDWASCTHAYGEATDVPDLLRTLLSADEGQREEAISTLFGNIWHQGTVYPATARAVPFLYELLSNPDVQDKRNIACLLSCIADGVGYLEVHAVGDYGESTWRRILADDGKTLEEELKRERAEINEVHDAVSAGLAQLVPFLRDTEVETRKLVAVALGNFPEHAAKLLHALEDALAMESDNEVIKALEKSKASLLASGKAS